MTDEETTRLLREIKDKLGILVVAAHADEPIPLSRFACCGRYVCRCGKDAEGA